MIANESDLRPWDEIQRAHDLLEAIAQGEVDLGLDKKATEVIWQALGVLCWTLRHDRAVAFEGVLEGLRARLKALGIGEFRIS
jgi:hypothetical protein